MSNRNISSVFYWQQRKGQGIWRDKNISTKEFGTQNHPSKPNDKTYKHIVPFNNWEETLFEDIRCNLIKYIKVPGKEIFYHEAVNNLLSSWVLCSNLYFLTRSDSEFKALMVAFLKLKVSDRITEITGVELEFAFSKGDELHPSQILGEKNGSRGKYQTSPDVAFFVKTKEGNGIVLVECKYTEKNFYPCSTNPDQSKDVRNPNPNFSQCTKPAKGHSYKPGCHQTVLKRKYMQFIDFSSIGESVLLQCPAASDGYQLFRQQALAEGIAKSGRYDLVSSVVAFDERNTDLVTCMKTSGINDFQADWALLFEGKALFKTWTHQEWVQFVRDKQVNGEFDDWLEYLNQRYEY